MAKDIRLNLANPIDEDATHHIGFDSIDTLGADLNISSVKVYVFVSGVSGAPVYINDRDGITNTSGLVLTGDNEVDFAMSAADNPIVDIDAYGEISRDDIIEQHTIRFEIFYNGGNDKYYVHFIAKVLDLAHVPVP